MSRAFLLALVAGSVVSGAGCFKHIAGKCDCTYDPADNVIPGPSNPYFPGATFTGPAAPVPEKEKAPAVAPGPKKADPEKKAPVATPEPKADTSKDAPMALPALPTVPVLN